MRATRIAAGALVSSVVAVLLYGTAFNMPMFTRKYQMECGGCHSVIPKLNKTGEDFRAAGFRMPDAIGEEDQEANNISTQNATRLQTRYDASRTDNAGLKTDRSQLTFLEITLYPLTGAFNKNYASLTEISLVPEEPAEIENAYVRGVWKAGDGFVSARAGIFHPFEGFGASDRPVSLARPLLQTTSANYNQKTFFTPWGFDEAGLEVGYNYQNTSVRATVFSGTTFDAGEGIAHPVQTRSGAFAKDPSRPDANTKDVQIFATQKLHPDGGGISLYFYNGAIALPVKGYVAPDSFFFKDKFQRYAGYASYPVAKQLVLLGGAQGGTDKTFALGKGLGEDSKSVGYFGEADVNLYKHAWLGARYDYFDPSDLKDKNEITAGTVAVNAPFNNGLQVITEFQYRQTKQGAKADKKDSSLQARLIWIW